MRRRHIRRTLKVHELNETKLEKVVPAGGNSLECCGALLEITLFQVIEFFMLHCLQILLPLVNVPAPRCNPTPPPPSSKAIGSNYNPLLIQSVNALLYRLNRYRRRQDRYLFFVKGVLDLTQSRASAALAVPFLSFNLRGTIGSASLHICQDSLM